MVLDVDRFRRLASAIRGTLGTLGDASTGGALADAYSSFREEARLLIGEDLVPEFERLFPAWPYPSQDVGRRGMSGGYDPMQNIAQSNEARGLLGRLMGWLDGFT